MTTAESQDDMNGISNKTLADMINRVAEGQQKLEVQMTRLEASMMPRPEIVGEVEKRVLISSYVSDQAVIEKRLTKLEQAPASARSWLNTMIAGAGCLGSIVVGGASITVSVLVATHIIGH